MKRFLLIITLLSVVYIIPNPLNAQKPGKDFFAGRRAELYNKMNDGVLLLEGNKSSIRRNSDSPERQDDNFWYLTGYSNPDAYCIIAPKAEKKFILFIKKVRVYTRPGSNAPQRDFLKEAMDTYGADTVYFADDLEKTAKRYIENEKKVYCSILDKDLYSIASKYIKDEGGSKNIKIMDPVQPIAEARVIKSPEEINWLEKAADITTKAEIEAMKGAKPGLNEKIIEAIIDYVYKTNWASGFGFESIVGSGPNSLVLHYMDNDQVMKDGTVCVMDIGAAYNGYSADITRTIPVNGKFTPPQKDIYSAVLRVQKEAIKLFKTGTLPNKIETDVANMLRDELYKLGLVTDKNTIWQYRIWYTHGCSHSIGLDVHDATPMSYYKEGLKPGMVFTIEPGLYVSETSLDNLTNRRFMNVSEKELKDFIEKVRPVAKKYNNIGVRIEDDVLITPEGNKVITSKCPKEIADVEKTMKQKSRFVD